MILEVRYISQDCDDTAALKNFAKARAVGGGGGVNVGFLGGISSASPPINLH